VQCVGIFLAGKGDDREPFANAANEEHGLLSAEAMLAGIRVSVE